LNILIIGLGSIAKKHIAAIKTIEETSVIYALRSGKNAEAYPGVHNISTLEELPIKPDFVIIANPTLLHEQAIQQGIDLGCPLFIEKPVLSNADNAEELKKRIYGKKILTYTACNLRFHPALQFLKKHIAETKPVINEVNIYCGSYLPDWRPGTDFRKSYSSISSMGGGVHLDLIHELDYCQWLFGEPSQINALKRSVSGLRVDAVDYANFTLLYPQFTANIILNYYRRDPKRHLELVMENDTLFIDLLNNKIISTMSGKKIFEEPFSMIKTYESQMRYFFHALKNKQQTMNDISEGISVLKMAMHE